MEQNRISVRDGFNILANIFKKTTTMDWKCMVLLTYTHIRFYFIARIYRVLSSFDPNSISTFCANEEIKP